MNVITPLLHGKRQTQAMRYKERGLSANEKNPWADCPPTTSRAGEKTRSEFFGSDPRLQMKRVRHSFLLKTGNGWSYVRGIERPGP